MKATTNVLVLLMVVWNSLFAILPASAYDGMKNNSVQKAFSAPASFLRPTPNLGKRPMTEPSTAATDYGALLKCVDSFCSDTNPGISLTEEFETDTDTRAMNFKILCTGTGCTQKNDVYYRIVYRVDWRTLYPRTAYASAYGTGYYGAKGTGGAFNVFCGTGRAGGCTLFAQGVIPGNIIHQDPNKWYHVVANAFGSPGEAYAPTHWKWFVQMSFDPAMLDLPLPEDIACIMCPADMIPYPIACGGFLCLYGDTQGTVGDPINTRTGAMTYPVEDLSLSIRGGTLAFHRVYNSSAAAPTSLGYGWTHNHNAHLVFSADPGGMAGFVLFKAPDGNTYRFWDIGNGNYSPFAGFPGTLTKSGSPATYTLRTSSQLVFLFDAAGKLTRISDAQGHATNYAYRCNGKSRESSWESSW